MPVFYDLDRLDRKGDFREWKNASLLKSYLQKCVRRKWTDLAIRTAYHLMRLNLMEFLRRFPIIAIEDSSTHPDISNIIWFMAIGDIECRIEYIRYFLGIVHYVSNSGKRLIDLSDKTIELRISFGGMKGDMRMLSSYMNRNRTNSIYSKIKPIRIEKYLGIFDLDICGADFHVFPKITDWIKNQVYCDKMIEYTHDEIKKTIWLCSSSINHRDIRKPIDDKYIDIWNVIQDYYKNRAQSLILNSG